MDQKLSKRDEIKLKNRDLIIATAERLMLQKNFADTSMEDVAKESGLTKRTIYKHFISKEDLFYAILVKGIKTYFLFVEEGKKNGENAAEKVRLTIKAYSQFYIDNPGILRLMSFQPDNMHNCELSPNRREFLTLKEMSIRKYMDIVEEGKADGSINSKLETKKAVYFAMFACMGLVNLVADVDHKFFFENQELDIIEFLDFSMELLADALT